MRAIIPKQQFVKLREFVLDFLLNGAEEDGHSCLQHGALERVIMYARSAEFHPFSGMSPEQRSEATDFFWESLVKAKLVEVVLAPVSFSGLEGKHYYLPGVRPFSSNLERLFDEARYSQAMAALSYDDDDLNVCDPDYWV